MLLFLGSWKSSLSQIPKEDISTEAEQNYVAIEPYSKVETLNIKVVSKISVDLTAGTDADSLLDARDAEKHFAGHGMECRDDPSLRNPPRVAILLF